MTILAKQSSGASPADEDSTFLRQQTACSLWSCQSLPLHEWKIHALMVQAGVQPEVAILQLLEEWMMRLGSELD